MVKSSAETLMGRALRLGVIQNLYDNNRLDLDDALELLRGELQPGDPSTICDDSDQLQTRISTQENVGGRKPDLLAHPIGQ